VGIAAARAFEDVSEAVTAIERLSLRNLTAVDSTGLCNKENDLSSLVSIVGKSESSAKKKKASSGKKNSSSPADGSTGEICKAFSAEPCNVILIFWQGGVPISRISIS